MKKYTGSVLNQMSTKICEYINNVKKTEKLIVVNRAIIDKGTIDFHAFGEEHQIKIEIKNEDVIIKDECKNFLYYYKNDKGLEKEIIKYLKNIKKTQRTNNLFRENRYFFDKFVRALVHDQKIVDDIFQIISKKYKNDVIEFEAAKSSDDNTYNHMRIFTENKEQVNLFRFLNEYFYVYKKQDHFGNEHYKMTHYSFEERDKAFERYNKTAFEMKQREFKSKMKSDLEKYPALTGEKI
jgi:hypothetical protein